MAAILMLFSSVLALLVAVLLWMAGTSLAKAVLVYVATGISLFVIAIFVASFRSRQNEAPSSGGLDEVKSKKMI